jgi:hypothetical protein
MLPRQPRSRRGNEGLNASPQRRMHHWCELRVVVDRQLVESIVLLGFGIDRRIGAAYKPKYRGHLPLGAKRSEILARGRRPSLTNVLDAEMPAKRGHDALGRIPIVDVERITIQRRDSGFRGAPEASASALTIRSLAKYTRVQRVRVSDRQRLNDSSADDPARSHIRALSIVKPYAMLWLVPSASSRHSRPGPRIRSEPCAICQKSVTGLEYYDGDAQRQSGNELLRLSLTMRSVHIS